MSVCSRTKVDLDAYAEVRQDVNESESIILEWLGEYAYNAMELCRILNGIPPHQFKGCYGTFTLNRKGFRCHAKNRGCRLSSSCVDARLRRMQQKGLVRSVKLRWFDGREKGPAKNALPMDNFRIYYTSRYALADRLRQDIEIHVDGGGGPPCREPWHA